ncbi:glutamate dehydrogenase [Flavobacteriales bacterium 33_180_T64]|nr:glutamate dehydrogenase [Flavobacteriales bacterium 33_180_T64]
MTLNFKQLTFILFITLSINKGYSQLGFSHEIGVITGPVAFQSDFGVRSDLETNAGNTGFGIGIVHYINFAYRADCNCYSTDTFFNDHFKLRNEISWNKTTLNHFGKWVDASRTSTDAERLRQHSGVAQNFDIGTQIEFFPKSIRSFQAFSYSFAPFVSLGVHFTSFNPKVETTYGDGNIENMDNFYQPWVQAANPDTNEDPFLFNESGTTWSVVGSVGTRYKLTVLSDLMIDLRWQYFFNNKVDGLDHNLRSNKAKDWLVWLNFGYIYYLD